MTRFRSWVGLLGVLLLCAPASAGATKADRYRGADELAARVDQLLDDAWKKADITPARPADDGEWLRRIYLDLAGRIPGVTEAHSFLADRRTDKRPRLVESLLAGPRYPTHFASVWLALLLPEAADNPRLQTRAFEQWLRKALASDRGYDEMVRDLLIPASLAGRERLGPGGPSCFTSARKTNPRSWPPPRRNCSWASTSAAPSVTTTPSRRGKGTNSGRSPPFSAVFRVSAAGP